MLIKAYETNVQQPNGSAYLQQLRERGRVRRWEAQVEEARPFEKKRRRHHCSRHSIRHPSYHRCFATGMRVPMKSRRQSSNSEKNKTSEVMSAFEKRKGEKRGENTLGFSAICNYNRTTIGLKWAFRDILGQFGTLFDEFGPF